MQTTLDDLARDLTLRGYAQRTQEDYLSAAKKLMGYFGRRAADLSREELREYVGHLQGELSRSALEQQLCGLLFLYRRSLGLAEHVSFISLPKRYSPLPTVLSVKEVDGLIKAIENERYQAIAMVLYGAGLRISEARVLEIRDIDGARGVIQVRHGKGNMAREAKLSPTLYEWLRRYWARQQPPPPYLFASKAGKLPRPKTINTCLAKAAKAAFIQKKVTAHILRHSFATHMLEAGVDAFTVSALLGHKTASSTRRYARVTRKVIRQTPSPLDLIAPPKTPLL